MIYFPMPTEPGIIWKSKLAITLNNNKKRQWFEAVFVFYLYFNVEEREIKSNSIHTLDISGL